MAPSPTLTLTNLARALLPESVVTDQELAPVLLILSHPRLAERAAPYVRIETRSFDWRTLLATPLSSGERLMVEAAASLWNHSNPCNLGELVETLSEDWFRRVLLAVQVARGWISFEDALAMVQ